MERVTVSQLKIFVSLDYSETTFPLKVRDFTFQGQLSIPNGRRKTMDFSACQAQMYLDIFCGSETFSYYSQAYTHLC